jgi:hypothetical protein
MTPFQFRRFSNKESLQLGWASWDADHSRLSAKFAWKDSLGRTARGGEVPIESLAPMLVMAIESGHLSVNSISPADVKILRDFLDGATTTAKRKRA